MAEDPPPISQHQPVFHPGEDRQRQSRLFYYRKEMEKNIAQTIGLEPNRINVKATTTEGLGLIGKGEGIGAMSIALISRLK